jgi:hypothetical protein
MNGIRRFLTRRLDLLVILCVVGIWAMFFAVYFGIMKELATLMHAGLGVMAALVFLLFLIL